MTYLHPDRKACKGTSTHRLLPRGEGEDFGQPAAPEDLERSCCALAKHEPCTYFLGPLMEKVTIIGSGCAGLTAALYTARANLRPLVLTGLQPGGLLTTTTIVENFPGFPEGMDGYELMNRMQKQAEKFGARVEFASVEEVDLSRQPFVLTV